MGFPRQLWFWLKHKILDVKWLLYHVSVSLSVDKYWHTFQWNTGLNQKSTGWCEFRNLCTAFWSRFRTHTHPVESQVGNIGIPTQPGIKLCLFMETIPEHRANHSGMTFALCSGSHSGTSSLVGIPGWVGILLNWVSVLETLCCIPEWLPEHICIQWNRVGFGFRWMCVCSVRLHCMCSACSAVHQHSICCFSEQSLVQRRRAVASIIGQQNCPALKDREVSLQKVSKMLPKAVKVWCHKV